MTTLPRLARGRVRPRALLFACAALLAAVCLRPAHAPAAMSSDALKPVPERRGVPRPEAVALDAPRAAAAESLAQRLGFATVAFQGSPWRIEAPLTRGTLVWYDATHDASFGERADRRPLPLTGLLVAIAPAKLPLGRWSAPAQPTEDGTPAHPNGAIELTGAFAIVPDFDIACERWKEFGSECDIGEGRLLAEIGGMTRVVHTEGGFYGFVEAMPGKADAVRRVGGEGPAWIGFSVTVRDADSTAAFFDRHAVPYVRGTRSGPGARLWVLPEHAGGVMIGFVQQARNAAVSR